MSAPTGPAAGVANSRYLRFRAGETVFLGGSPANGFYTVLEGEFERLEEPGGQRRRLRVGDCFGDEVLQGATRRTHTVRALTDACALFIDSADFARFDAVVSRGAGRPV